MSNHHVISLYNDSMSTQKTACSLYLTVFNEITYPQTYAKKLGMFYELHEYR